MKALGTDLGAPIGVVNTYATLQSLKARLAKVDNNDDLLLWHLLHVASRMVENYCGRHFYVETSTKRFDVTDRNAVQIDDLVEVLQLVEDRDSDGVFECMRYRPEYVLYPLDAQPQTARGNPYFTLRTKPKDGVRCFPVGRATVQITGRWGFRAHVVGLDAYLSNAGGPLSKLSRSISVDSDANLAAGQTIMIGAEQLFVRKVTASALSVTRAVNGTPMSEHADGTELKLINFPPEVTEATLLLAVNRWSKRDGYVRTLRDVDDEGDSEIRNVHNAASELKALLTPFRRLSI